MNYCENCKIKAHCHKADKCIDKLMDKHLEDIDQEDRSYMATAYAAIAIALWISAVIIMVMVAFFLSSRPAGASHGRTGDVILDCCPSTNRASGTSYRAVALAFQPYRYTSVFEVGTREIEYILSWPHLESTTSQLIRLARQRLAVVLTMDAVPAVVRSEARLAIDRQRTIKAIGAACFFGGLMLLISFWPYRKDGAK